MPQSPSILSQYDELRRAIEKGASPDMPHADAHLDPVDATPILPAHIDETVRAIAKLHADHDREATASEKAVERLTAFFAEPRFVVLLTLGVAAWVSGNLAWRALGHAAPDPPPFSWLQGALTMAAVYMTSLILTTQRRASRLAGHREQLTLELAILGEQKNAKTIELLEELRRDNPFIKDRVDRVAEDMSTPADPEAVLAAIQQTHEGLLAEDAEPTPDDSPATAGT